MKILDNSNIVESYPGLCSPLTCSFAEEVYRLIFQRLSSRVIGEPLPTPISQAVDRMATAYEGRMYYRIDNWYRLLQILPFSHRLIPIWQRSLGVDSDDVPVLDKGIRILRRLRVLGRFISIWRRTPAMMRHLADEFTATQARFKDGFSPVRFDGQHPAVSYVGSLADLGASYAHLRDDILRNWDVTLVNDLRAFGYIALAQRLGCPISGASIASLEPVRALAAVRHLAATTDDLAQLHTASDARHYLARATPLASAMADYIERYGDRGPEELKLETQTFRTHPGTLVSLLRPSSQNEEGSTSVADSGSATDNDHDMARSGRDPRGLIARAVHRRALEAIAFREESRLNRSRIFGMVRGLVRVSGGILAEAKVIDAPEDVFYLTIDEVFDPPDDSRKMIAVRREEWEAYDSHTPPDRIVLNDGLASPPTGAVVGAAERQFPLRGVACSAGRVVGAVTVVIDPATVGDVSGRIIVARSTDPGWVFLLSQAAGVVTERGSLLSHTAIIARELGLPALVGVEGATTVLRTGDEVCLDSGGGRVDLLVSADRTQARGCDDV